MGKLRQESVLSENSKGSLLIIAAMAIFSLYGVFVRSINASPEIILFFNALIVALIFCFIFLKNRENFNIKKHWLMILALGAVFVGNNFFFFTAFKLTTMSNAILAHYTAPIFVAVLAPFLLKERMEKNSWIALLFSFIGLIILGIKGLALSHNDLLGILFGTGSGLMYGLSIIVYKYLLRDLSALTLIFYQSLLGSLILAPFIAPQITLSLPFLWFGAFALLFGIIATFLHFQGMKRVKAQHAGIIGYSEPLFGTIYGFLFFAEKPTIATAIGGGLIILGGIIVLRNQNR